MPAIPPATGELSGPDSLMWRMAADPVLRSPILVVALLDRLPRAKDLDATMTRAAALLPGLRSRIVPSAGPIGRPRWVPDPDFSLDHHVHWVGATTGGMRGVLDLAEPDVAASFDPERPPWSCTIVEGLAAGHAAFLLRFHHAVTDGMGGLLAAADIFDHDRMPHDVEVDADRDSSGEPVTPAATPPRPGRSLAGRAVDGARSLATTATAAARDPLGTASGSLQLARSVGRLLGSAPSGSPLLAGRSLDRHLHVFEVPFDEVQAAARTAGGTINDVLLAVVGGAFRSYHEHHGESPSTMSVTMPVDRRRAGDDPGGNRFVPVRFTLPVDEPDVATRVRIAGAIARDRRHEPALDMSDVLADGLNLLPAPLVTRVFGGMLRNIDADVVDLPGLVEPVYIGGARIERMWAFAPTAGSAFSVTLLSHADTCCVAVSCDRRAVARPELLGSCLEASLDEVLGLAHPKRGHGPRPDGEVTP